MGKIYHNILELVGHTPIVELHRIEEQQEVAAKLLAKLEFFNPGGSVKDRIAKNMLEEAEKEGKLKSGYTIVEGTSGNTGIGVAAAAAAKGYQTIIVMPDNLSRERISILKAYGAKVVLTAGGKNMGGAAQKVEEIAKNTEHVFVPGQGANPNNPDAHRKTTGPEIWEDTDGKIDILIATVGTGGTITGAGEFLREKNSHLRIIAVEPARCPVISGGEPGPHKIQGIGGGLIPPVMRTELFDEVITVTDDDAYDAARNISVTEGIMVGISAGAAIWAAVQVGKRPENEGKNIVLIIPDSGERYLSSDLYEV